MRYLGSYTPINWSGKLIYYWYSVWKFQIDISGKVIHDNLTSNNTISQNVRSITDVSKHLLWILKSNYKKDCYKIIENTYQTACNSSIITTNSRDFLKQLLKKNLYLGKFLTFHWPQWKEDKYVMGLFFNPLLNGTEINKQKINIYLYTFVSAHSPKPMRI